MSLNSTHKSLERELKNHDSELFLQETHIGRIDVCRKSMWGSHPPNYICSLTKDWSVRTEPVPWGIEVVLSRIKAHDLWNNPNFMNEWEKSFDVRKESEERSRRNSTEAFLYDFRRQFQRATNEINTSTLEKIRKEY